MSRPADSGEGELTLWRIALDTFRDGLTAAQAALDAGGAPEAPSWPPSRLPVGPMPSQLEAEARTLLGRSDELTKQLLDAMDRNRVAPRRALPRGGSTSATSHARWSVHL